MFPISKSVASKTGDRVQIVAHNEDVIDIHIYGVSSATARLDKKALHEMRNEILELSIQIDDKPKPKAVEPAATAPAPKPAPKKKAAKGK